MKKTALMFFLLSVCGLWAADKGLSDTVYTKDNKEIKGIIVEEYKDRVLISTVDGEQSLMKSDVKELYYDTEEQNLIKLAEKARDKGDFIRSFVYYDKAFKVNPDSRAAKDGIVFLQGYLFKKDMAKKEEDINRRNDFEKRSAGAVVMKTEEEKFAENINKLREVAGITLDLSTAEVRIESVTIGSPAYDAGMKRGDILIAVWGRFVKYLSLKDVVEMMLEKTSLETKCTIERGISAEAKDLGATFKMMFDGMTISEIKNPSPAREAGLMVNDIIVSINGKPTRYMPLKKGLESIKNSKGGVVKFTIRRDLVIWGKAGG